MAGSRAFAGTDRITLSSGTAGPTGAFTIAVAFRLASNSGNSILIGDTRFNYSLLSLRGRNGMYLANGSAATSAATVPALDTWYVAAVSTAAGTATPRFSLLDLAAGTVIHADADTAAPDKTIAAALSIGDSDLDQHGDVGLDGLVAAAAIFPVAFTDVERADMTTFAAWQALSPVALWRLDGPASAPVLDASGHGADQTDIDGTTQSSDAPPCFWAGVPDEVLLFADDFSNGLGNWTIQSHARRIGVVSAPGGRAGRAVTLQTNFGDSDDPDGTDFSAARNEMYLGATELQFNEGDDRVIRYSAYFDPSWPDLTAIAPPPGANYWWCVVNQTKQDGTGSPPWAVEYHTNDDRIGIHGPGDGPEFFDMDRSGTWHDFEFRLHFSSDPAIGHATIYVDGMQVVDYATQTLVSGVFDYWKMGVYRHRDIPETMLWYVADFSISIPGTPVA